MDFARKQLQKFGWTEGSGLGKDSQGILSAIKPTLKVGKEGMGFDLSKDLVDTWWTRAYDDSLQRINIKEDSANGAVGVSIQNDEDEDSRTPIQGVDDERPFLKMKKRMMKASFPTFSKGATLSNGEMISEPKLQDHSQDDIDKSSSDNDSRSNGHVGLTDEELFKACGGRTAHKAARFGLKLNGKLARIAAQEEEAKALIAKFQGQRKSKEANVTTDTDPQLSVKSKKDKKRKKLESLIPVGIEKEDHDSASDSLIPPSGTEDLPLPPSENDPSEDAGIKKRKKHKKRKHQELATESESIEIEDKNSIVQASISEYSTTPISPIDNNIDDLSDIPRKKHKKKDKKRKNKDKSDLL